MTRINRRIRVHYIANTLQASRTACEAANQAGFARRYFAAVLAKLSLESSARNYRFVGTMWQRSPGHEEAQETRRGSSLHPKVESGTLYSEDSEGLAHPKLGIAHFDASPDRCQTSSAERLVQLCT